MTGTTPHSEETPAQVEPGEGEKRHRAFRWQPRNRKSWKEMSPAQRSGNIVLALAEAALTGWALWDLGHRPEDQVNGKKRIWFMTTFIQPFGPVIYLVFGRRKATATT